MTTTEVEISKDLRELPREIESEAGEAFADINTTLAEESREQIVEVDAIKTRRFLRGIGVRNQAKRAGVRTALINSPASAGYNLFPELRKQPIGRAVEAADEEIQNRLDEVGECISG